jgi:hypothetical protein
MGSQKLGPINLRPWIGRPRGRSNIYCTPADLESRERPAEVGAAAAARAAGSYRNWRDIISLCKQSQVRPLFGERFKYLRQPVPYSLLFFAPQLVLAILFQTTYASLVAVFEATEMFSLLTPRAGLMVLAANSGTVEI